MIFDLISSRVMDSLIAIADSEPAMIPNVTDPASSNMIESTFSESVFGTRSPNPTVVSVVTE